jgi:hypothetical protein
MKLNHEGVENLNRLRTEGFTGEFYQTFKELIAILVKLFQNLRRKKYVIFILIAQTMIVEKKESYRLLSLMNTDAKILNKILANPIQWYVKNAMHQNQVGFILGIKMNDSI